LPIVALTADATPEMREQCRQAGMDDVALKPIEAVDLLRIVEQFAGGTPAEPAEPAPPLHLAHAAARDGFSGKVAAPRAAGQVPLVDPTAIEALRKLGDGFFETIVDDFIAESGQIVGDIVEAVAKADTGEVRLRTHALRSSAAHFGARRLHFCCLALSKLTQEQLVASGAERGEELRREFRLVVEELRRETARPARVGAA
jgi:HPt (histidine-containing phosphotransfer) domain-containing protein